MTTSLHKAQTQSPPKPPRSTTNKTTHPSPPSPSIQHHPPQPHRSPPLPHSRTLTNPQLHPQSQSQSQSQSQQPQPHSQTQPLSQPHLSPNIQQNHSIPQHAIASPPHIPPQSASPFPSPYPYPPQPISFRYKPPDPTSTIATAVAAHSTPTTVPAAAPPTFVPHLSFMEGQFATHALILEQQRRIKALEAELASTQIELMRLRASVHASNDTNPNPPAAEGASSQPNSSVPNNGRRQAEDASKKASSRYWTADEHARFLEGLELFGQKDIKSISRHVGTRSATQVRTHAQKYYLRIARERAKAEGTPSREAVMTREPVTTRAQSRTNERRSGHKGRPRVCYNTSSPILTANGTLGGGGASIGSHSRSHSAESGSVNGAGIVPSHSSTEKDIIPNGTNQQQNQASISPNIKNGCRRQLSNAHTGSRKENLDKIVEDTPLLNDNTYREQRTMSSPAQNLRPGRKRTLKHEANSKSHLSPSRRSGTNFGKREDTISGTNKINVRGSSKKQGAEIYGNSSKPQNQSSQQPHDAPHEVEKDESLEQSNRKSNSNKHEDLIVIKNKHLHDGKQTTINSEDDIQRQNLIEVVKKDKSQTTDENGANIAPNASDTYADTDLNSEQRDEAEEQAQDTIVDKQEEQEEQENRGVPNKRLVHDNQIPEGGSPQQQKKRIKTEKEMNEVNGPITVGTQLPPRFGEKGTMGLVASTLRRNGSSNSILADLSRSNSFLIPHGRGVTRSNSILSLLSGMPVMRESPSTDRLLGIGIDGIEDKMALPSGLKQENSSGSGIDANGNQQVQGSAGVGNNTPNGNGVTASSGVATVGTLGDRSMSFGQLNHMGVDDLEDAGTVALSIDHNYYSGI